MAKFKTRRWSPAHLAALAREDEVLDGCHPGEYVAYIDTWVGDRLTRRVLAHTRNSAVFQQLLAGLDAATRRTVTLTRIPDADTLSVPSVQLA